jgi:hypothetical protein
MGFTVASVKSGVLPKKRANRGGVPGSCSRRSAASASPTDFFESVGIGELSSATLP